MFLVLASCFLVHLSIGTLYTYGNLVPYIVSYVREYSSPIDLRFTDAPYVYACQVAGQGCSMIIGGLLERRFGPRLVTLAGGFLMSGGVALSYFSIRYSFWLMLVTYGLMFGFGTGLAYVGPLACAMRWLPKWKGLASGIVVSGFGLSGLVFNAVQTEYINPDNLPPDFSDPDNPEIKYFSQSVLLKRVPNIFLILSACYVSMQIIGCVFIVNPPPNHSTSSNVVTSSPRRSPVRHSNRQMINSDERYEIPRHDDIIDRRFKPGSVDSTCLKDIDDEEDKDSSDNDFDNTSLLPLPRTISCGSSVASVDIEPSSFSKIESNYVYNLSPLKMLSKFNFYILWVMFFFAGTLVTFISSLYKSFALEKVTHDDHFLAIVGGTSAIFNLLGRLFWGGVADLTTYKVAFVMQGGIMTSLLFTLFSTVATGKIAYLVWVCAIYFCVGGYYSLFPAAVSRLFGQDNVGINYGILFTSQIFAGLFAGLISQFLVEHIFWYGMFFFIGGLSGLEFVLALLFRHKRYLLLPSPNDLMENVSRIEESSIRFPDSTNFKLQNYD